MNTNVFRSLVCYCLLHLVAPAPVSAAEADLTKATAFVQTYCVDCHNQDFAEADRQFDRLRGSSLVDDDIAVWHEVLDRLNIGDMPPKDANQPSDDERLMIVSLLTNELASHADQNQSPATHLRRLNRREYDAAVRHTLDLQPMLADPTSDFPPDESTSHFDNIGDTLVLSDFLLTQYLRASKQYLDVAADWASTEAETKTRTMKFDAPFCKAKPNPDGLDVDGEYQHLRENTTDSYGYLYLKKLRHGVGAAGRYRIRVRACGINRVHPYNPEIIATATQDPLQMAIVAGQVDAGDMATNNPSDRTLATFEVADDTAQWYEATSWLDAGWTPRITFPGGPVRVKYMRHWLLREHRDLFPNYVAKHVNVFASMHPDYDKQIGPRLEAAFVAQQDRFSKLGQPSHIFGSAHRMHTNEAWSDFYREYRGPRLRVFEVQLIGPLSDNDNSMQRRPQQLARQQYFFPSETISIDEAATRLHHFASRAMRRAVDDATVQPFERLMRRQHASGMDAAQSLRIGYQAILCSPGFLYHRTTAGRLDTIDRANRLAFFLSGKPTNERIRALASQPDQFDLVLNREIDRMIDEDGFVDSISSLADSWLHLDKLGSMPPDRSEHPAYYNQSLRSAMRQETILFLTDAFRNNAPVQTLVSSDYSFINGPLARLYGIDGVTGGQMRRVTLDDPRRGGLMTMASVLTTSANGIDTSPVLRGVWVLECLLGTPPSPPPPDIEPIEPDTRGTTTIREQLAAHRNVATCAACHDSIDPPGFALESYDEIGRWRDRYDRFEGWRQIEGPKVDPSGNWMSAGEFEDVVELKRMMLGRVDLVRRNLVEKLLTAATGRINDPGDRAEAMRIVSANPDANMRDLIHAVVASPAFGR